MCHLEENFAKYQHIDFLFFQEITFRIRMFYLKYRSGRLNANADAITRKTWHGEPVVDEG